MEPSQLNFEALTFVSRKDLSAIAYLMRQTIQTTYKYRISANESVQASAICSVRTFICARTTVFIIC